MMAKHTLIKISLVSFSFAQLISIFGDRLHQFSVVGMIGMLAPGSSFELLLLSLFTHLPVLLLAPLFGPLLDRWRAGAVLVTVDFIRGAIVFGIPALYLAMGNLYAFYGPVFLLSLANMLFSPAKSAIIPEMVEKRNLVRVNAALWGVGIIGTILGFLAGGWFFDFRSWELSFYTDGASYMISVIFLIPLLFIPVRKSGKLLLRSDPDLPPVQRSVNWIMNIVVSIKDGIDLIRTDRTIAISLLTQTSLFAVAGVIYVIGIGYIQNIIEQIDPETKTFYLSMVAISGTIGLLIGTAVTGGYRGRLSDQHAISIAIIVMGVAITGIAKSDTLIPLSIWSAALGITISPVIIYTEALLQKHIPEKFRGRVFSNREILTRTAFLGAAMVATAVNTVVSKAVILVSVGLFLALTGMLLERSKIFRLK